MKEVIGFRGKIKVQCDWDSSFTRNSFRNLEEALEWLDKRTSSDCTVVRDTAKMLLEADVLTNVPSHLLVKFDIIKVSTLSQTSTVRNVFNDRLE